MRKTFRLSAAFACVLLFIAAFPFAACSKKDDPYKDGAVSIGAMNGPTMIGLAKLDRDMKDGKTENLYSFEKVATPTEITAGLISKKYDAAALSSNTAAFHFNNPDLDVQIAAVNVYNVFYLVVNADKAETNGINSLQDLSGKTIHSSGKDAVPEFVLKYLLEKNGLTDSVGTEFYPEPTAVVQGLLSGIIDVALLPQPAASTAVEQGKAQGKNIEIRLDFAHEWKKTEGNADMDIITGVLVVRRAFLKNNKDAFDRFLADYKTSVNFMKDGANLDAAAELVVDLGIIAAKDRDLSINIAKSALPLCGLTYADGVEMKDKVSAFYKNMFDQNKAFVGGKLPTDGFYYI